ncbi:FRG domain-containing protein, partial [bacterium]|nr:FRG domain-containing protein [bacterium]
MKDGEIIGSFPDLLKVFDEILKEDDFITSELWFRGEPPDVNTPLTPSVWRYKYKDLLYEYESQLYTKFYLKAPSRYINCPRSNEYYKWLFLMQHYGLPTRLLDWTESILVAVYFAIKYAKKYDGDYEKAVIWALKPHRLNEKFLGIEGIFVEN